MPFESRRKHLPIHKQDPTIVGFLEGHRYTRNQEGHLQRVDCLPFSFGVQTEIDFLTSRDATPGLPEWPASFNPEHCIHKQDPAAVGFHEGAP